MTEQKELQALIADIDSVLSAPRSGAGDAEALAQSNRILEEVRGYLSALPATDSSPHSLDRTETQWQEQVAGAIAQAAIAQMNLQRATWTQPWQMELEAVRQQRDALHREIQQLEGQRQTLIADFLQVLMNRISTTVEHHITQALETVETRFLYAVESAEDSDSTASLPGNPSQRLEQLKQLDRQSDRLLTTLDSTFRQVFETLERDLQGYQDALSKSIRRLYDLGSQGGDVPRDLADSSRTDGTAAVAATEGGDAQASISSAPIEEDPVVAEEQLSEVSPTEPASPLPDPTQFYLFPGAEIPQRDREIIPSPPPQRQPEPPQQSEVESMSDAQIDTLLEKIDASEAKSTTPSSEPPVEQAELEKWDEVLFGAERPNRSASSPIEVAGSSEEERPTEAEQNSVEAAEINASSPAEILFGSASDPSPQTDDRTSSTADLREKEVLDEPVVESQPTPISREETSVPTAQPSEPIAPADRIESLAELIEQAYTSQSQTPSFDAIGDDYAPVQPGESLLNSGESEVNPKADVGQVFEQANAEQLAADLNRFQKGDCSESVSADAESFSPPEELVGENYEQIPLENISVESDLWKESTPEQATDKTAGEKDSLPQQINIDPWTNPARQIPDDLLSEEESSDN